MSTFGHTPYALAPPTMADLHSAVLRICGPDSEAIWRDLLDHAGVQDGDTDDASFARLLSALHGSEPALRLAARAATIRRQTYEQMSMVSYLPAEQTA